MVEIDLVSERMHTEMGNVADHTRNTEGCERGVEGKWTDDDLYWTSSSLNRKCLRSLNW